MTGKIVAIKQYELVHLRELSLEQLDEKIELVKKEMKIVKKEKLYGAFQELHANFMRLIRVRDEKNQVLPSAKKINIGIFIKQQRQAEKM